MFQIQSQVNFEETPCNGPVGPKALSPCTAVHIVYQRFVSDYSLAIASLDLTDIICSDPT